MPFFVLLALAAALLVAGRRRVTLTEAAVTISNAAAASQVVRLVPLFATVSAPVVCRLLDGALTDRRTARAAAPGQRSPDLSFNSVAVGVRRRARRRGSQSASPQPTCRQLDAETPQAPRWLVGHDRRQPVQRLRLGRLADPQEGPRSPVWIGVTSTSENQLTDYDRAASGKRLAADLRPATTSPWH